MVTGALSTSYSAIFGILAKCQLRSRDWASPPALSTWVSWQSVQDCISIQQVSLEAGGGGGGGGAVKLAKGITQEGVLLPGPRVLEGHILAATLLAA